MRSSLALTRAARDAGFDVVVAGQHFLTAPAGYLQPVPLLARLVPETGAMRLATGVLLLPLLHPVQVAEDLATLDVLSDGRLVVGVGQGYRDVEFEAFGIERETRLSRQLESLELLKQLWRGEPVEHEGEHYRIRTDGLAMLPVQSPHPPIWYAASSGRTVRRAVDQGYVPYLGPQVDRSAVAELTNVGESPASGIALRRDVLIREIVDDEEIRRCIASRDARYASWGYGSGGAESQPEARIGPEGPYLVGSLDECAEQLRAYGDLGVGTVVLRSTWDGLPMEASIEMIAALDGVAEDLREAS